MKLEQRVAKLEDRRDVEPIEVTRVIIEPGTMRVIGRLVRVDGKWQEVPKQEDAPAVVILLPRNGREAPDEPAD